MAMSTLSASYTLRRMFFSSTVSFARFDFFFSFVPCGVVVVVVVASDFDGVFFFFCCFTFPPSSSSSSSSFVSSFASTLFLLFGDDNPSPSKIPSFSFPSFSSFFLFTFFLFDPKDKGIPSFSRSAKTSATSASETSSYVVVPLSFTFSHTFMAKDFNPPLICSGVAFVFGVVVAAALEAFLDDDGGGVDIIIAFSSLFSSPSFFAAALLFFTGVFLFLPDAASFLLSSRSISSSVFVLSKYSAISANNLVLASRASFASFSSYGSFSFSSCFIVAPMLFLFAPSPAFAVTSTPVFENSGGRTLLLLLLFIPLDNEERLFAFRLALIGGLAPILPPNTVAGDPSRAKPVKGRCRSVCSQTKA